MGEPGSSSEKKLMWDRVREQGFFDKSPLLRIAIILFFAASLFFFLHNREVRVEILELGTDADRYVVAQVDFEFLFPHITN